MKRLRTLLSNRCVLECAARPRRAANLFVALSVAACLAVPGAIKPLKAALHGDAKFTTDVVDADVKVGYGLAIGRVDSDDWLDVILADKKEIAWYRNPGVRGAPWPRHVMARNLTARDNVCVAARDLDGDGLVEVAVGAQWNPGETTDASESGALFLLTRSQDPTHPWKPHVISPHDPTVHRMHWVRTSDGMRLLVLPLHGVGNRAGKGTPVMLGVYQISLDATGQLSDVQVRKLDTEMHMTHNFHIEPNGSQGESVLIGGREGIRTVLDAKNHPTIPAVPNRGAGEVRTARLFGNQKSIISIEPMHGLEVVAYVRESNAPESADVFGAWTRHVVATGLNQGHALAAGDLIGTGQDQIVAGWRNPDSNQKVGIRMYVPPAQPTGEWSTWVIDDNTMACEDLKLADLDKDGRLDVIAAGRATNNLNIYWNDYPVDAE